MKVQVKKLENNIVHLYDENGSLVGVFNEEDFFIPTDNRILAEYLYKSGNYELIGVVGTSPTFVFVKKESKQPRKRLKDVETS